MRCDKGFIFFLQGGQDFPHQQKVQIFDEDDIERLLKTTVKTFIVDHATVRYAFRILF